MKIKVNNINAIIGSIMNYWATDPRRDGKRIWSLEHKLSGFNFVKKNLYSRWTVTSKVPEQSIFPILYNVEGKIFRLELIGYSLQYFTQYITMVLIKVYKSIYCDL